MSSHQSAQIILGIDPGLATTGWGVLKRTSNTRFQTLDYGTIKTSSSTQEAARLEQIYRETARLIAQFNPHKIALEKLFFGKNAKTAMRVEQAKGVILLAATQSKLVIEEYTPLQIKITITGYGRADKQQMQKMIQRLLKLNKLPQPSHAADALAVALTAAFNHKYTQPTANN